jgi:hypothetical protein
MTMLGVISEKMVRLDEEDTLLRLSMAGLSRRMTYKGYF